MKRLVGAALLIGLVATGCSALGGAQSEPHGRGPTPNKAPVEAAAPSSGPIYQSCLDVQEVVEAVEASAPMVSNGYSPGPPDSCGYGPAESSKKEPRFDYYFVYSSPDMIDIISSGRLYSTAVELKGFPAGMRAWRFMTTVNEPSAIIVWPDKGIEAYCQDDNYSSSDEDRLKDDESLCRRLAKGMAANPPW
jgi:hypothetical protein